METVVLHPSPSRSPQRDPNRDALIINATPLINQLSSWCVATLLENSTRLLVVSSCSSDLKWSGYDGSEKARPAQYAASFADDTAVGFRQQQITPGPARSALSRLQPQRSWSGVNQHESIDSMHHRK
jgi:hypothetical protein